MLQLRNVTGGYGKKQVLFGVSLVVRRGELVAIIGPNGAGKSTVFKVAMGYLQPWEGLVFLNGQGVRSLPTHERVARRMGYVPQGRVVFPDMTVDEHLDVGAWLVKSREARRRAKEYVFQIFPRLAERRGQKAGTMSGGERQMLSMGRALMAQPTIILLDEPSLGLSPKLVDEVFQHIETINRAGVAVLMVEQNAAKALRHAHRAYVIDMGKNHLEGSGKQLLDDPEVRRSYLGG
ncbi:MAG: ABC transporter ATP-binding protein [Chloroflexi bacterium]|nr:ABC transporter ATP-binding protein [Chloroflexota bacterium]